MRPQLPQRISRDAQTVKAATWNRLLECLDWAMRHPAPDGATVLDNGDGTFSARNARSAGGAATGGGAYDGPFAVSVAGTVVHVKGGLLLFEGNWPVECPDWEWDIATFGSAHRFVCVSNVSDPDTGAPFFISDYPDIEEWTNARFVKIIAEIVYVPRVGYKAVQYWAGGNLILAEPYNGDFAIRMVDSSKIAVEGGYVTGAITDLYVGRQEFGLQAGQIAIRLAYENDVVQATIINNYNPRTMRNTDTVCYKLIGRVTQSRGWHVEQYWRGGSIEFSNRFF